MYVLGRDAGLLLFGAYIGRDYCSRGKGLILELCCGVWFNSPHCGDIYISGTEYTVCSGLTVPSIVSQSKRIAMIRSVVGLLALWAGVQAAPTRRDTSSPVVSVKNGSYAGVTNTKYNQDFFLGIPYAQQPVGDLRFTVPQSLNETWDGERDAKAYSDICVGYGVSYFPSGEVT